MECGFLMGFGCPVPLLVDWTGLSVSQHGGSAHPIAKVNFPKNFPKADNGKNTRRGLRLSGAGVHAAAIGERVVHDWPSSCTARGCQVTRASLVGPWAPALHFARDGRVGWPDH